jgi:hypothetical protein
MRHQSIYFNRNRGPPSHLHKSAKGKARLPSPSNLFRWRLYQISGQQQNNKGSNSWCDPTVRALRKSDTIARIRSLAKVIVSLSCRKRKAHFYDLS